LSIDHRLTLDYELQAGWLQPFVNGLQSGSAIARRCSNCHKTTFPPTRVCDCEHVHGEWIHLSGKAHIVHRSEGADGSFALVQFEGADTKTVVRQLAMTDSDTVGYLQRTINLESDSHFFADSEHETSKPAIGLPQLIITRRCNGDDNE